MSEAEAKKTEGKDAAEAHGLEYIYQTMNLAVPQQAVDLAQYKNTEVLASSNASERIGAALAVFIESVASSTQSVDKIDKAMLDYHIAEIDRKLSLQLDEIMHHPSFQKMETSWRSLKFLVDRIDFKKNVKLDILDASKEELATDFEDAPETIQSGLYKHVYVSEYDTPAASPTPPSCRTTNSTADLRHQPSAERLEGFRRVPLPLPRHGEPQIFRQGDHAGPYQDRRPAQLHGAFGIPEMELLPPDRRLALCRPHAAAFHAAAPLRPRYHADQGLQLC